MCQSTQKNCQGWLNEVTYVVETHWLMEWFEIVSITRRGDVTWFYTKVVTLKSQNQYQECKCKTHILVCMDQHCSALSSSCCSIGGGHEMVFWRVFLVFINLLTIRKCSVHNWNCWESSRSLVAVAACTHPALWNCSVDGLGAGWL